MSRAACLALGLALAGLCGNAQADAKARQPLAIVYVTDEGCVARTAQQDGAEWLDDQRAAYRLQLTRAKASGGAQPADAAAPEADIKPRG